MIKKAFSIFMVLFSITISVKSQNKIDKDIEKYFDQWKKAVSTIDISDKLLKYDNNDVLSALESATADTSVDKRYAAYRLIDYIGHKVTTPSLCKRAIKQLIFGLTDRDGGIVGANLRSITAYDAKAFDAELKYMISELAKKPQPHYDTFIKICGWLNISDLTYDFRQAITEKKGDASNRWTMRLAMARMGESDMVDYCLQKVQKIPVTDDVVYDLVPDIIYTRQKAMFDYLLTLIESDEKNCSSSNPASDARIICAYRIIEEIAPYIECFPVEVGASGDLKTKNYEKALADVRNWIIQNRATYMIKKEGF